MLGLFCGKEMSSNEEYRGVVKRKMWILVGLFVIGAVSCIVGCNVCSYVTWWTLVSGAI